MNLIRNQFRKGRQVHANYYFEALISFRNSKKVKSFKFKETFKDLHYKY